MPEARRLRSWISSERVVFDETVDGLVRQVVKKGEKISSPITFNEATQLHGELVELTQKRRDYVISKR